MRFEDGREDVQLGGYILLAFHGFASTRSTTGWASESFFNKKFSLFLVTG
jgi:hypothetical protein